MKSLLEEFAHNNFLVSVSNWFVAPDGKYYRAAWGKVRIYNDEKTLGIKTNSKSANWYAVIGEQGKSVIVAGCQIHYACVCMEPPFTGKVDEVKISEAKGETFIVWRETNIYLAQ
jgi:hypothetical protein